MNADLPAKPSTYTSVSGVAHTLSQTLNETRLLSGPLAGSPVPRDLIPLTCTWLASISRPDARSTVAPAAGRNVTADVMAERLPTTNSGAGIDDPAEYVPAPSSTPRPPDPLGTAPL